ncbi:hypothetical protein [Methanosarcina sp. UBA411]|jgi:hypothetical protein|uniref:hypothetical protein n=1 Tax=Methanosarcina sp. UBA411 TaxID=1915589 RepID=UPI0025F29D97|nr:hypothetical protein [Methanosarcina sp. UBA411]
MANQMTLYCTRFNFCREHVELKYKDGRSVGCKNTPAREAGIIDSKWTLKNVFLNLFKRRD